MNVWRCYKCPYYVIKFVSRANFGTRATVYTSMFETAVPYSICYLIFMSKLGRLWRSGRSY